jgi:hypothetical protein
MVVVDFLIRMKTDINIQVNIQHDPIVLRSLDFFLINHFLSRN